MARTIGLSSELEVVNSVLSVTGDAPVQSLDDTYQPVYIIRDMINTESRRLQTEGFWFNTERGVELTTNQVTGTINVPFNILKFEPSDNRYVLRGSEVYDKTERTNLITGPITADLYLMMTFEQLPQSAREYLRTLCRIRYNNEYFGEQSIKGDLQVDFQRAKTELDKEHIDNEQINIFEAQAVRNVAFKNRRG